MSFIFNDFEDNIIENLKKSELIERFSEREFKNSPSLNIIIDAFETASIISFDDQGLFFFDKNNEKIYCPELNTSISEKGEWLSDKLPLITFDIDQNGNVRKADEAEALYCCICVANILKEKSFKLEVDDIVKSYDFSAMKSNDDDSQTFRNLLISWQDLQSVIINILISACKFRISDVKKDIEKFLRDGISDLEAAELREMDSKIRAINFNFSENELSPIRIKDLSKIEKLTLINKRDQLISEIIKVSRSGTLYRLLQLSSEYISPIKKKKIFLWVRSEVDKKIEELSTSEDFSAERTQIISRLQRRSIKFEKNSVRKLNIEKYLKDKENFKFPSKL